MNKVNPAVVLGLSPGGLYLVRALSELGVPVYGASKKNESGICSRHLPKQHVWRLKSGDELLAKIEQLNRKVGTPVLLPASDEYIEWISEHSGKLKDAAFFSTSYFPKQSAALLDKNLFYAVCEEEGIAYPRRMSLSDLEEVDAQSMLRFPVIIKPGRLHEVVEVMGSRKVFVCENRAQLDKYRRVLPRHRGAWLVQEIVRGPDNGIYCLGGVHTGDGKIEATISGRKLRQFPAGYGTAAALRLEPAPPELWEYTRKLVASLQVDGLFEIEFKQDIDDTQWKVFEINARTALWFGAARSAGIPLAAKAYELHSGGMGEAPEWQGAAENGAGIIWRTGLKNMLAVVRQRNARTHVERAQKSTHISAWAFWELTDPLPMCKELLSYFRKAFRRIIHRAGFHEY